MNGKQRVALAGVQLALVGMWSCASDPNNVITGGTPQGGGGASAAGSTSAGASGSGVAGQTIQAGASGAPVAGGSGGSSDGGASMAGGSGGSSAGGSGAGAASICTPSGSQVDCNNVLMGMDGYANKDLGDGPSSGSDAKQFNCTNSEANPKIYKQQHWRLMGPGITEGKAYKVDLHFYGVVECKNYKDGSGPAKTDNDMVSTTVAHNLWMQGVKDNGDHWNTYTFTVTPNSSDRLVGIGMPQDNLPELANTYVINQCPKAKVADHYTYRLDFSSSITVPGGSYVNYVEYDTNCRMIANCGAADAGQSCNGPYNLVPTVSNVIPSTNVVTLNQPLANTANPPSRGQWWVVDVTAITALP